MNRKFAAIVVLLEVGLAILGFVWLVEKLSSMIIDAGLLAPPVWQLSLAVLKLVGLWVWIEFFAFGWVGYCLLAALAGIAACFMARPACTFLQRSN